MIKYKIRINKIGFNDDSLNIISSNGLNFTGQIKKGSVNFKIYNEDKQEVNLSNLDEGNLVKIYGNKIKNNIIIKKIIIKNNYSFNSDSSDEIYDFD